MLVLQATPYGKNPNTAIFDVSGLRSVLTDASHADTKDLQDAPDVAFQILAQSDHTLAPSG